MSETTPHEATSDEGRGSSAWSTRIRRALTRRTVVWMSLIGGALLLISSTLPWVSASGLGSTSAVQEVEISGAELVETVTAMGLVGLAAGLAVTIAKLLGRVLIGSVLFGASIIALLAIRAVLADPASAAAAALGEITGTTAQAQQYELSAAVWMGLLGALLLLIAALALLLVSHRWPDRRARKYQVSTDSEDPQGRASGGQAPRTGPGPASTSGDGPQGSDRSAGRPDPDEFDLWDGLSEGTDPTDPNR
ncbi:Trp biosynthesis-associated membrane protein [Nesterenkonia lutea]|uniref:Membrane protein (TIGR02234 family) n=1 Tax=Nesterenkonia lutea TaxID=272919 RepID=A0ABR9JE54_9MICC|nr:Trp biosynthesis-associated membrane protein [Nesterenkonia lutea]MBE1524204.1 putative membrane protein (TIGR02234 family) [Nesterenkonia lutea]